MRGTCTNQVREQLIERRVAASEISGWRWTACVGLASKEEAEISELRHQPHHQPPRWAPLCTACLQSSHIHHSSQLTLFPATCCGERQRKDPCCFAQQSHAPIPSWGRRFRQPSFPSWLGEVRQVMFSSRVSRSRTPCLRHSSPQNPPLCSAQSRRQSAYAAVLYITTSYLTCVPTQARLRT